MPVYRAQGFKQRRVFRQRSGGPVADLLNSKAKRQFLPDVFVGIHDCVLYRAMQFHFQQDQLFGVRGARIEAGHGPLWNGIDGSSAFDRADIQRSARRAVQVKVTQTRNGPAQYHNRIGASGIGPGVSSRAAYSGQITPAPQRAGHGHLVPCAIQNNMGRDLVAPRSMFVNPAHAAQVPFALFAYIACKNYIARRLNVCMAQGRSHGQKRCHTRAIVTCSGSKQLCVLQLRPDGRLCRKYRVNMRGKHHATVRRIFPPQDPDRVANTIYGNVCQAQFAEACAKPFRSWTFCKWRRRYSNQLPLPAHNLLLMQMQPAKRLMHTALRSQMADARKCGRRSSSRHKSQRSIPSLLFPGTLTGEDFHETALASVVSKKADLSMSLKAKIEAVIYAAEEPVSLAHLAGLFADEALEEKRQREGASASEADTDAPVIPVEEAAPLTVEEAAVAAEQASEESAPSAGDEKKAARQRDREAREELRRIIAELIADYADNDRGMEVREIAGGYRVATKPEYHDAVRAFVKSLKPPMKLSLQALETLAVIAYKQPITAPEVSEIRGVDSAGVIGSLISRKLVTTAGRKQVIGRPILYKTTKEFLLRFGLKDLNELPSMEEFEKMAAGELAEPGELPFEGQKVGTPNSEGIIEDSDEEPEPHAAVEVTEELEDEEEDVPGVAVDPEKDEGEALEASPAEAGQP
jgi:segregation and condensation protein B